MVIDIDSVALHHRCILMHVQYEQSKTFALDRVEQCGARGICDGHARFPSYSNIQKFECGACPLRLSFLCRLFFSERARPAAMASFVCMRDKIPREEKKGQRLFDGPNRSTSYGKKQQASKTRSFLLSFPVRREDESQSQCRLSMVTESSTDKLKV